MNKNKFYDSKNLPELNFSPSKNDVLLYPPIIDEYYEGGVIKKSDETIAQERKELSNLPALVLKLSKYLEENQTDFKVGDYVFLHEQTHRNGGYDLVDKSCPDKTIVNTVSITAGFIVGVAPDSTEYDERISQIREKYKAEGFESAKRLHEHQEDMKTSKKSSKHTGLVDKSGMKVIN